MSSSDDHPCSTPPVSEDETLTSSQELENHPYRNPSHLEEVYTQVGTIAGTASSFGISEATARTWLIRYDFYDPETDGLPTPSEQLQKLTPEDLGLSPIGERE
jgi:hypothetical protein